MIGLIKRVESADGQGELDDDAVVLTEEGVATEGEGSGTLANGEVVSHPVEMQEPDDPLSDSGATSPPLFRTPFPSLPPFPLLSFSCSCPMACPRPESAMSR